MTSNLRNPTALAVGGCQGIGIWALVIIICVATFGCSASVSRNTWNNGIHASDGGHWIYEQMISRGKYGASTDYIYRCDKCGKTFESTVNFGK